MWIELRIPTGDVELLEVARRGFAANLVERKQRASGTWLEVKVSDRPDALDRALRVLVAINVIVLRRLRARGVVPPSLYSSGIRYEREPEGREWWQTVIDNFREMEGDCEDLGCHLAAELIVAGEPAEAVAVRTAKRTFHCVTKRADGTLEDPSAALGMRPLSAEQRARAA